MNAGASLGNVKIGNDAVRKGLMATIFPGVLPSIFLASDSHGQHFFNASRIPYVPLHEGSLNTMPFPFDIHQCVGGTQVDGQIIGKLTQDKIKQQRPALTNFSRDIDYYQNSPIGGILYRICRT